MPVVPSADGTAQSEAHGSSSATWLDIRQQCLIFKSDTIV
jgi:hypothetical protein